MRRRDFLAGAAGLAAGARPASPGVGERADAVHLRPHAADGQSRKVHRVGRQGARRGPEVSGRALRPLRRDGAQRGHLGRPPQARVPADAAREIRAAAEPQPRLRARLPRHRLRRDDLRPAHRRPHDLDHRSQEGREGARDRHRLRLPVGLSLAPDRSGLHDRDHQAARRAHPRHLRQRSPRTATPSSRRSSRRTPTAITAGKRTARSTRSSSPAASTTCRRRCCSS